MLDNNQTLQFVAHHNKNYNGQFPIWAIIELFTFGMLSYFYTDMHSSDKKVIARNSYNTCIQTISSWLNCCSILRNICAHYGRLYYSNFTNVPTKFPKFKDTDGQLFSAIMAVQALYPDIDKWNTEALPSLKNLIDHYSDVIDLKHIGFPDNWFDIMVK
jgi:abortive infection bacteriophage resistance protein